MAETVQIGEREYRVERFTIYKAELVGDAVSAVFDKLPQIDDHLAKFRDKYREQNSFTLTRATAEFRHPDIAANMSDAAWEASDQRIVVPVSPAPEEELAHAFPLAFQIAREEVLRVLAIVSTSNQELEDAEEADDVDVVLDKTARRLRHSDLAEVLELGELAMDVVKEQMAAGKLQAVSGMLMPLFGLAPPGRTTSENESDGDPAENEEGSTSGSPNGSGPSDDSSPEPTGEASSTDSRTAKRSTSRD